MNDKNNKEFLTAKEISEYFRIPLNTIYRLTKGKKIKGVKVGKQWRYARSDIEEIISGEIDLRSGGTQDNREFQERRAYSRINCNLKCRYRTNIPDQLDFISYGNIKNISGGGIFLHDEVNSLDHIHIDDPIDLIINFISEAQKEGTIINAKGRIVRKTDEGVGIKFRNIKDEYKDLIIQYVG